MTGTTTLLLIIIVILIAIVLKGWYDNEKQQLLIEEQERTIHALKMTIEVLKKKNTEMKTREQAEARAIELFPPHLADNDFHGLTKRDLNESYRKAFLQCWDEMQEKVKCRDRTMLNHAFFSGCEAKEKCMNLDGLTDKTMLHKMADEFVSNYKHNQFGQSKQEDKQTCGFCVEPKNEKE